MARRRQTRLTRQGFYYLLVLLAVVIGATLRQLNLLILLGTVLAGPLVFSFWYGRFALKRVRIERRLPPILRADQRLNVDIQLTNARRWLGIWSIVVEDQVVRDDSDAPANPPVRVGVLFPAAGRRETVRGAYQGELPGRGRYRFGPLVAATRFPLGLVRHRLRTDDVATLIVHPRLGRLTHDWTDVVRRTASVGQAVHRRGLQEAEFHGLRDWRTGDSRRWIHWRSSARRGSLVVRQFEEQRSRDLALLVDLWQPEVPSEEDREDLETAVSFVATLVAEGCRQPGRRLILSIAASEHMDRSGAASPLFFRQQMDELALIEPHHDRHFPVEIAHTLAMVPPSTPTLLVSTRPIDWTALECAVAERNAHLTGRHLQSVDVSGTELARYYQD